MARSLLTIAIVLAWSLAALPNPNLLAAENLPDLRGVPTIVYGLGIPKMEYSQVNVARSVPAFCRRPNVAGQDYVKLPMGNVTPGRIIIVEEEAFLGFTP
ncbi:hypothetical protein [Blastopirellula marina]|uniref:Uncharacterized protein n=1 Tax=Blastopirellula marina TaxID=124 RepID=A0A2S8FLF1_9BACT|nr:hypothetical protein [Blastopirellula marina]PQO33009.1 hypothetical protein C5Y98_17895 [Blastopirellula marina]PTL43176.1 hypothetical protein C5Y97_17905 [Blastopirellula marina]